MGKLKNRNSRGFSILELMVAMAIFLTVSGAVLAGMSGMQTNYRTTEISTQMEQQLRSTMELMAAEIGQAGLQSSTLEGGATGGDASYVAPYKITTSITATGSQTVNVTTATGVLSAYIGQWLVVDGGSTTGSIQEAVQVTGVTATTITANFGKAHTNTPTPAYPIGVFPHGILSDQSNASPNGGGKLAMFGEINGSGNGLWAVEYTCPTTFPGPLTRTAWNLSTGAAGTKYNLIDNVTACYFCWPGVSSTVNSSCPQGATTPDTVTLALDPAIACPATGTSPTQPTAGSGYCTYPMITQVGFTITALENVTISGTTQPISITKSYSNIQPRNMIAADNIYKTACTSAINAGNASCSLTTAPYQTYATYLYGELQPDPPALASMTTNNLW